ncbi:MAG: hypothetical protein COV57_01305 [Candidatus Liptonbacteria bacterium CG11_big_fil_rev_8_21_14_0_20_35_14]|uniref:Uncharacterized protein n=1 Tax=Candidatus Liptonbacteria bacterium CG11_big_fil_rev_8_21_14_0_20_35_14 TaxID=1974634 RepID=A0A2H0N7Z8_9BACT|nr:MAG: hypothetical protein COV57_01305 [Candidatus Liptonbacteria bacterium CG11_big_fil_rev_8_21_14_0_20_35_14]
MLILLYGPNTYSLNKKLNHIKNQYHQKYIGISEQSFTSENEESLISLNQFCQNNSLFESNKLGIIKNLEDWPEKSIKKILEVNIENKNTTLIITSSKKPKALLSFLLKKPVTQEEFKTLNEKDIISLLKEECQRKKISLTKEALNLLIEKYQTDLNSITQELAKLSLLNKSAINDSDIRLINHEQNFDFFFLFKKLTGSITIGEKLTALHTLKYQNEDEAKIFNMLAGSWNIKKTEAANLDKDIKSGRLEYNEAILKLIIK